MARKDRYHLGKPQDEDSTPVAKGDAKGDFVSKEEFGRRVYRAMVAKGMSQSDLHRSTGLTRDSISGYVRGRSFPGPINLHKLADALGVEANSLLPNPEHQAIREDTPSFEMRISNADPNKALLRVNRIVKPETAAKVVAILNEDRQSD